MDIRRKMAVIVIASILLTAIPASILVYRYAQSKILTSEISKLLEITRHQVDVASQRFLESKPKLEGLSRLLQTELAKPITAKELDEFRQMMELNPDGVWRNRHAGYNGSIESGIFLPPNEQESDAQKIMHLRIKRIMDVFGSAASKRMENIWYLSPHRSEIIFDTTFPNFTYDQKANNNYTTTPWVTYTSPKVNPERNFGFTPPLFDPVPKVWMVSAIYPLYLKDEWLGTLGEDMQLSNVLGFIFKEQQLYPGTQNFLLDSQGNFVLAGNWQQNLEATIESKKLDFDNQPQLEAVFHAALQNYPQLLADNIRVNGNNYVAIGMTLQPVNWRYFKLIPSDEILKSTRQLFFALVTIICLVSIMSGLLISLAVHRIVVSRIRLLADTMRLYEMGEKRHVYPLLPGNDEISLAAKEFDVMMDRIDANVEQIHLATDLLKISEERWKFALEGVGDGVWDWNMETGEALFSKRWKQMIGYQEEELPNLASAWDAHIHPDDKANVHQSLNDYFAHITENYAVEFRLRHKDGGYKWILARGLVVKRDSDDKPIRMIGTHTDITERKLIDAERERLLKIIQDSPDFIGMSDMQGHLQYQNSAAGKILGLDDCENLSDMRINDMHPEWAAKRVMEEGIPTVLRDGFWQSENALLHRDGHEIPVSQLLLVHRDEFGNPQMISTIMRDITESKRAENALQQAKEIAELTANNLSANEEKYRKLFHTSQDSVILVDSNEFLDCNPTALKLFGYSTLEEFCVLNLAKVSPVNQPNGRNSSEAIKEFMQTAIEVGHLQFEWWLQRVDGSTFPAEVSLSRVTLESQIALQAIVRDLSERKQIEHMLIEAKETAETLAQSKSAFLANMSHEIRTPMNAIIGLSELALNQAVSGEVRDYLEKINTSSASLLGILNDILDFSKIEAGKLGIEAAPFNIVTILGNLHKMFSATAEEKQLDLSFEADINIPNNLVGDALRIHQILSNLLGNAIKFTHQGQVNLMLQLLEQDDTQARILFRVSDTGIGISKADQFRLFHPFNQADESITRRFGGTGLGLAISQSLLQLMGSQFHVDSSPGKGTSFSFDLQLGIAMSGSSVVVNRPRSERKANMLGTHLREYGQTLSGSRILVAEDNVINQQVVKEFLKLSGMKVDIANNGLEALQLLELNTYSAILMDVHMPEMGGVEATGQIRSNPKYTTLPIIALSAGVTQEERANCLASGMNDFVAKPINPEQLINILIKWANL